MKYVLLAPFYKGRNWDSERLGYFLNVTQLINGELGVYCGRVKTELVL